MTEPPPAEPLRPRLRRAGPGAAAELARLAERCFAAPWAEASWAAELAAPGGVAWLAAAPGGADVGLLLAHRVLDELEIRSLAVAPEARRRGVARALLHAALEAEPARIVHLEVRAGNAAALALYTGAGFSEVGRRPRYYPDGEDALLLSRSSSPVSNPLPDRQEAPRRAGGTGS